MKNRGKTECAFCELKEINERVVTENKLARAFLTNIPITLGHTLIAPKRHIKKFEELTSGELGAILELRTKVALILKKKMGAEGFHFAWNEGGVAGQSVPHFHLHIVPRKKGDEGITDYEPRKFLYRPGSRAKSKEEELKELAKNLSRI